MIKKKLTALRRHIFSLSDPRQPIILMEHMTEPIMSRMRTGSVARLSREPGGDFSSLAHIPMMMRQTPPN